MKITQKEKLRKLTIFFEEIKELCRNSGRTSHIPIYQIENLIVEVGKINDK